MQKLYRIPDKTYFRLIFTLIILFNLKYLFLLFQIPYTMLFVDYIKQNEFYSEVSNLQKITKEIKDFHDEGEIGFISNVQKNKVFDIEESIKFFYIVQYAIVPSILKNDTEHNYLVGKFNSNQEIPDGFKLYKKINDKTYIFKKVN